MKWRCVNPATRCTSATSWASLDSEEGSRTHSRLKRLNLLETNTTLRNLSAPSIAACLNPWKEKQLLIAFMVVRRVNKTLLLTKSFCCGWTLMTTSCFPTLFWDKTSSKAGGSLAGQLRRVVDRSKWMRSVGVDGWELWTAWILTQKKNKNNVPDSVYTQ